jgi:hypothetical protein
MAERAKGKGKGKKGGNGIGHNNAPVGGNVADEVYRRWLGKIDVAEAAYDRANETAKSRKGELRQIYATAEEDGCNITSIKDARKKHKQDHATVAQDYADTGRVLRIMKSPLAIQLQLFDPVDWSPETRAALEGELAGRRGDPIEQNPNTPGSPAFQAYDAAWRKGQKAMADQTLR